VASSGVWPGRKRPRTPSHQVERSSSQLRRPLGWTRSTIPIGAATSNDRPTVGPKNDGGVTPTTVKGTVYVRAS
jgi:hypothetical protein